MRTSHDHEVLALRQTRYRTPLCVLYPPQIIATACYVLAQRIADGPNSPSLDSRISSAAPSASLPTPPSHKATSPDASRLAIEHYSFSEADLTSLAGSLLRLPIFLLVLTHIFYQRLWGFFSNSILSRPQILPTHI